MDSNNMHEQTLQIIMMKLPANVVQFSKICHMKFKLKKTKLILCTSMVVVEDDFAYTWDTCICNFRNKPPPPQFETVMADEIKLLIQ